MASLANGDGKAAVPRICADTPADFDRAAFHREFDAEVVRFFSERLGK